MAPKGRAAPIQAASFLPTAPWPYKMHIPQMLLKIYFLIALPSSYAPDHIGPRTCLSAGEAASGRSMPANSPGKEHRGRLSKHDSFKRSVKFVLICPSLQDVPEEVAKICGSATLNPSFRRSKTCPSSSFSTPLPPRSAVERAAPSSILSDSC